jgi:protein-tyrosine phosphatase
LQDEKQTNQQLLIFDNSETQKEYFEDADCDHEEIKGGGSSGTST